MRQVLLALAAIVVTGIGHEVAAGDGYYYAPPAYYAAPPVYGFAPVYAPPVPVIVHSPVYYAPPPVVYAPPPVAYYAPAPIYGSYIRARPGKVKVREYTPWGTRKYEWELSRHGFWELDD